LTVDINECKFVSDCLKSLIKSNECIDLIMKYKIYYELIMYRAPLNAEMTTTKWWLQHNYDDCVLRKMTRLWWYI